MKKIFALVLALALLLPMGLVPVANAEGEVKAQPFYVLSWSDMNNLQYSYLDGLVQANFNNIGDKATLSYSGSKVQAGSINDADVDKFCQALKKTMDNRPEGLRYLHLFGPAKIFKLNPKNVVYLDHAADQMREIMMAILKRYKEIDGKLDGLVIDVEYIGMSCFYIYTKNDKNPNNAVANPLVYKDIIDDPRYLTEVRPMLEERGFKFYKNITDYTPEIYSIAKNAGEEYAQSRAIWDTVMRIRLNNYSNKWAYEPLKEYFPESTLSDYQSKDSYAWDKISAATDDGEAISSGNTVKVGNVSTTSFYYGQPKWDFFNSLSKYASFNDAIYEATPFNTLMYYINYAKHMYQSNPDHMIAPWITSYVYGGKGEKTMAYTHYYTEQLYHLGLLDPEPFLSYTYRSEYDDVEWPLTQQIMQEIMAELTRVAGYSDRKPINVAQYWNYEFLLSGMYANGRNIWRITPNETEVSLENFKVAGASDPTFTIKGVTVTFPGGKIIEDTPIGTAGSYGYWVETSKDVNPVVTNDPERYQKYPSLIYDFEDVAEGTYDYNNHTPAKAWEFTWKKGATTTIETANGTKVLSMNGNVELRSANLPNNITAGDTYAEDQAWEITVTVPEGMAAEGEIVLLNYVGNKQKTKDGGFKIAGGKLYYCQLGPADENGKPTQEYVELMDISAGTYNFKRVMNFNDAEKFVCDYYVYDASGKELKSAKGIQTPVFDYIKTINFTAKDVGKSVHLDNYKITLTGTATDFELYDAKTGMPVTDKDTARSANTAYRLSWLNATNKEETATVMAAVYEGDKKVSDTAIAEIKMAPGYDGVKTGIVEVKEGQTVKVYLTSTTKGGAAGDNNNGGSTGAPLNLTKIIAIAVTVLALATMVVVLVLNKKPAKAAPKAEETDAAAEESAESEETKTEE